MNICESLTVTAKIFPDRTAIIFGDVSFSYAALNQRSIAAATVLRESGIGPGDRVALMLPNTPSFAIWYYAVLRIGAIAVSIGTRLAHSEVEFTVSDCAAKAFIAGESAAELIRSLPETVELALPVADVDGDVCSSGFSRNSEDFCLKAVLQTAGQTSSCDHNADPKDAALILYTSGTTGFPKGATLSHGNVRSNVHAFNHLCNMQPDDVVLLAVPLFHCFGQNALLNSVLNVGGTLVLQQRFDLNESKQLIADHAVTQLYGVPMMFGLLLESCSTADLASVNYCFSAAAPMPIQTANAWREKFSLPIHEGYGLTETSPFATYNHRLKFVPGSIGTAIDSVELKIVDTSNGAAGETCPTGELGEIAIRGPNVMLGYWNRPEETAAAIRDGWFFSGDIGRIDEEGYLYIVDRVKDMIAVAGLKVFPAEVERILLDHAAVSEAAVIGMPDSVLGEQVIAYLVLDQGATEADSVADIIGHAKSNLGAYKVPRRLEIIDSLPRNPSGKVLKTQLREMAAGLGLRKSLQADSPSSLDGNLKPAVLRQRLLAAHDSEKQLIAIEFLSAQIRDSCETDANPLPEDTFIDAGLDSLAIVAISAQLQVEVGPQSELPPTLLFDHPRICDMASFLVETISGSKEKPNPKSAPKSSPISPPNRRTPELAREIVQMSEDEALAELMKELE